MSAVSQVAAGARPAVADDVQQVAPEVAGGPVGDRLLFVAHAGLVHAHRVVGQPLDRLAVVGCDADQVADDAQREAAGRSPRGRSTHARARGASSSAARASMPPRSASTARGVNASSTSRRRRVWTGGSRLSSSQRSNAWKSVQRGSRQIGDAGREAELLGGVPVEERRAEPAVAERGVHVRVPGEVGQVVAGLPERGGDLARHCVRRVRVRGERGVQRVEEAPGIRGGGHVVDDRAERWPAPSQPAHARQPQPLPSVMTIGVSATGAMMRGASSRTGVPSGGVADRTRSAHGVYRRRT